MSHKQKHFPDDDELNQSMYRSIKFSANPKATLLFRFLKSTLVDWQKATFSKITELVNDARGQANIAIKHDAESASQSASKGGDSGKTKGAGKGKGSRTPYAKKLVGAVSGARFGANCFGSKAADTAALVDEVASL